MNPFCNCESCDNERQEVQFLEEYAADLRNGFGGDSDC